MLDMLKITEYSWYTIDQMRICRRFMITNDVAEASHVLTSMNPLEEQGLSQKLNRVNLRNQAADLLRDYIISGRIPVGTKIVERKVAEILGISRSPAREALMQLEQEGLIVTKSDARYIINLNERDILELHEVRLSLEQLAARLAAKNTNPYNQEQQLHALQQMEAAIAANDQSAFAKADILGHALIWHQAENAWLERTLHSMSGPIFMFMANAAGQYDWRETLDLHRDLVAQVNGGDCVGAVESVRRHLANSCERALGVLQTRRTQTP